MRELKRSVAKARMRVIGLDRINRRMKTEIEGQKLWRKILTDKDAHNEQARQASGRFKIKPVYLGRKVSA